MGRWVICVALICSGLLWIGAVAPVSSARTDPFYTGAVTSDHPQCSAIGAAILAQGGSSVDASIATMICIGATNLFASGIGGGGFAMVKSAGSMQFYDFRETAPFASEERMFAGNPGAALHGGKAVAVPGELRGFEAMHRDHGRLPWKQLFIPTVRLCRTGIAITELQIKRYKFTEGNRYLESVFRPNGRWLEKGEKFYLPALANTLEIVANEGVDAFYNGRLTPFIVGTIQRDGGIMTAEDLMKYRVKLRTPIQSQYGPFNVYAGPPPTAGVIILKALNIMEHFPCCSKNLLSNASFWHAFIEALKFAYSSRVCLADPDSYQDSDRMARIVGKIVSKKCAAEDTARIDMARTFSPEHYFTKCANHNVAGQGTSHVNVYGPDDVAVSMTSSINTPFGALLVVEGLGIILNNHMDDFSGFTPNVYGLPPSAYNRPAPGKRPQSSCSPLIITDEKGRFVASVGASGGSQIISAVIEVLTLVFQVGLTVSESISYPRIHHQLEPNEVVLEDPADERLVQALRQKGHVVRYQPENAVKSAVSVIYRNPNGKLCATNDPRKFSTPAFV